MQYLHRGLTSVWLAAHVNAMSARRSCFCCLSSCKKEACVRYRNVLVFLNSFRGTELSRWLGRDFLRERAYPWLKDVAVFLDQIAVKGEDGKRKLKMRLKP